MSRAFEAHLWELAQYDPKATHLWVKTGPILCLPAL